MTQPRIDQPAVCPQCGGSALLPARDKQGQFWICASCSWNRERAIAAKQKRVGKRRPGGTSTRTG